MYSFFRESINANRNHSIVELLLLGKKSKLGGALAAQTFLSSVQLTNKICLLICLDDAGSSSTDRDHVHQRNQFKILYVCSAGVSLNVVFSAI